MLRASPRTARSTATLPLADEKDPRELYRRANARVDVARLVGAVAEAVAELERRMVDLDDAD